MVAWAEALFCGNREDIDILMAKGDIVDTRWHLVEVLPDNKVQFRGEPALGKHDIGLFRLVIPTMAIRMVENGAKFLQSYHLDEARQLTNSTIAKSQSLAMMQHHQWQLLAKDTYCSVIAYDSSYYLAKY